LAEEKKRGKAPGWRFHKEAILAARETIQNDFPTTQINGVGPLSKVRLVWLALAGFFPGSALCPFNPPAADQPDSVKERAAMNSPSESRANVENEHFNLNSYLAVKGSYAALQAELEELLPPEESKKPPDIVRGSER
jgi:hypothetical protein